MLKLSMPQIKPHFCPSGPLAYPPPALCVSLLPNDGSGLLQGVQGPSCPGWEGVNEGGVSQWHTGRRALSLGKTPVSAL